jgi:predicted HTH transcriptional regulator
VKRIVEAHDAGGIGVEKGGHLLIGVADDGLLLGLESDMATLGSKGNAERYELFLRQLLDVNLTVPTAQVVRIRFEPAGGKQVCLVAVGPASRPVFGKGAKGGPDVSGFWVRVGKATKQLHGRHGGLPA